MRIIGYYIHGNKQYVAFTDDTSRNGSFKITDGFHDRAVTERNKEKFVGYRPADRSEIDVKKIASRMRGARPWHPLLKILVKEAAA